MAPWLEAWQVPTPFPVGPVNAYRLEGAVPALIDAGPRTPEAEAALLGRLRGRRVEVLIATHEHVDHAGLARTLQRDHGVRLLLHRDEARALETWTSAADERERDYERGLRAAGVPGDLVERLRRAGRRYDLLQEAAVPDATFRGGDRIELGDRRYEVVDAPGHTAGSFLLTDGEVTFSGDTLLEHITPNAVSVRESERRALVRYLETLGRLRSRDWGLVHPGHGAAFRGADAVIERGLRHAAARQGKILRELALRPRTVYELVQVLFPVLGRGELFLGVSELRGHLEALVEAGRAVRTDEAGVHRYAPK